MTGACTYLVFNWPAARSYVAGCGGCAICRCPPADLYIGSCRGLASVRSEKTKGLYSHFLSVHRRRSFVDFHPWWDEQVETKTQHELLSVSDFLWEIGLGVRTVQAKCTTRRNPIHSGFAMNDLTGKLYPPLWHDPCAVGLARIFSAQFLFSFRKTCFVNIWMAYEIEVQSVHSSKVRKVFSPLLVSNSVALKQ